VTTTFWGIEQSKTRDGKKFGEAEFQNGGISSSGAESFGEAEFRRSSAFGDADFRGRGGWGVRGALGKPHQEREDMPKKGKGKAGDDQGKGVRALAVVGGVAANQELRRRLQVGREWGAVGGAFSLSTGPLPFLLVMLTESAVPFRERVTVVWCGMSPHMVETPPKRGRTFSLSDNNHLNAKVYTGTSI